MGSAHSFVPSGAGSFALQVFANPPSPLTIWERAGLKRAKHVPHRDLSDPGPSAQG